jgi:5'-nucleotidase / UDP-sugar diphosphatase
VKISRRTFIKTMALGTGTVAYLATGITVHGQGAEAYTLRIIHTNDHHARIEPVPGTSGPLHGGVSRRKTLIDAIRAEGGNQLLLDAGDVFQGTLYFNQYRGQADLEFYNAMGYQAMTVGNHEFDLGPDPLVDFIRGANFPVLSANMRLDPSSPLNGLVQPWTTIWVGGQPIGVIGVTTEDTAQIASPGPLVSFTPYIDAVRQGVQTLRAQGVNKIIALTHVGIDFDRQLAREVDGIGVIIGGHTHTPMGPMLNPADANRPYPEVIASPSGRPVVIATDWEWGRWLGDLTVGFDADGNITSVVAAEPTEVLPSVEPDPGFEQRITVLKQPIDQLRRTPVGEAAVALNGERGDVRTKETNLGNLIADAFLAQTRRAGAQIAIQNGGSIRASIAAGPVTVDNVLTTMPFGNTLTLVTLTGAQVKEALENGVSQVETTAGRFPQVGAMRYSWDPSAAVGSRITGIQVSDGQGGYTAIDPNASYRLVTSSFLVNGGDGYTVLGEGTDRIDIGFIDSDALIEYFRNNSPVSAEVEGRIVQSGALPGAGAAPTAPGATPAQLPNTSGQVDAFWLLAALGAAAVGSGFRLRGRAHKEAEQEVAEEEVSA